MKDLIGIAAISLIVGAFICLAAWGIASGLNKINASTQDVRVIELGGHKYVIITNEKGVAICPVPK